MLNDNVPVEKISVDFGEELGNNDFGIQDTQIIASRDLQNFLLNEPEDVQSLEDEKAKEKLKEEETRRQQQQQQETPEQKIKREDVERKTKDSEPDGKQALEDALFDTKDDFEKDQSTLTPNATKVNEEEGDDTFKTWGKDLLRLGIFTKESEDETEDNIEINSGEELLERFQIEKKKGAIGILDNFLSQYGEDYRKMFDAVFVNGVKPDEYLNTFSRIETIKDLDLTQESNQEKVVRTYYKGLKWTEEKIESRIKKLIDYGDLEDEAKTYHEVLLNKEVETANAMENAKVEEAKQTKDKEIATVNSYKRILAEKLKAQEIDGIPLTADDAEKVVDYMNTKKFKLQSGELLSEMDKDLMELNRPENHEMKIKLGLLLRKKLDLASVKKTTISKKSDTLFTLSTKNAKQKDTQKEREVKSFF